MPSSYLWLADSPEGIFAHIADRVIAKGAGRMSDSGHRWQVRMRPLQHCTESSRVASITADAERG
jgi:ABC-type antimicrobial peptide transport system ATPase subunit